MEMVQNNVGVYHSCELLNWQSLVLKDKYFIIVMQIRSKSCAKIEWSNATATTRSQERGKTLFRKILFTRDFVSLFTTHVHCQCVNCSVPKWKMGTLKTQRASFWCQYFAQSH